MKLLIVYLCCLMFVFSAEGQQKMVLTELAKQGLLSVYNRKIAVENDVNGPFIRVSQDKGEGIVWLPR